MRNPFSRRRQISARVVCFWLKRGETTISEGSFTVLRSPGVSCFGGYRHLSVPEAAEKPAIFEGVILEHELGKDDSASIGLKYYSAEPDKNGIGFRQVVEIVAGLSMGSESGVAEIESVMLAETHEFFFRSHTVI